MKKKQEKIYFQPDWENDFELITPNGVELWSYYVYSNFDNARKDFPDRKIIAYKGDDIENPYFIDGGAEDYYHVRKKQEVTELLINIFNRINIDIPSNFDEILEFVYEDVCVSAHETDWTDGDVAIAFRRFIESKSEL